MTKADERDNPDSTWNRTADDEPIFILCARDVCAPLTVLDWVERASRAGVAMGKLREAFEQAIAMQKRQAERGSKLPD